MSFRRSDKKHLATSRLSKGRCRVCGEAFFKEPLLRYENMPAVAQHLPDAKKSKRDRGVDLELFMCAGCGLTQLDSEPVSYYKEVIRAAGFSAEMREFRLKQFKDFFERFSLAGKKVLEIGSGRGEYLALMQQSGAQAFGLEYSADAARDCARRGLNVIQGFVERENYGVEHAPFDAFFILSFLEHLPKPNDVLRGIAGNLAPAAVGIVEVPNFDMILRDKLFSEFMRDHLFYFTRDTLSFALRRNGYEVLSCDEVWHDYILSAVVRKREKLDLSVMVGHKERLKREIDAYVGRFRSVAVWGAGHQAFAMMALMNLGDRIRYVVDSAPFKQGKFTPATHVPIVAPETLRADPVDAVIVMTGSYSDEVTRILRRDFNRNIRVAVLRDYGLEQDG